MSINYSVYSLTFALLITQWDGQAFSATWHLCVCPADGDGDGDGARCCVVEIVENKGEKNLSEKIRTMININICNKKC